MKKTSRGNVHVGISSLLLVFLVLCLISFAVLSLANARADYRLSSRYAENTRRYYEACMKAQEWMAEVSGDTETEGGALSVDSDVPDVHAASFPVTDTQTLFVEVSDGTVITWQLLTDESAYELDESLPVVP